MWRNRQESAIANIEEEQDIHKEINAQFVTPIQLCIMSEQLCVIVLYKLNWKYIEEVHTHTQTHTHTHTHKHTQSSH